MMLAELVDRDVEGDLVRMRLPVQSMIVGNGGAEGSQAVRDPVEHGARKSAGHLLGQIGGMSSPGLGAMPISPTG